MKRVKTNLLGFLDLFRGGGSLDPKVIIECIIVSYLQYSDVSTLEQCHSSIRNFIFRHGVWKRLYHRDGIVDSHVIPDIDSISFNPHSDVFKRRYEREKRGDLMIFTLKGDNYPSITMTPNGSRIVGAYNHKNFTVWNGETGEQVARRVEQYEREKREAAQITPDGRHVIFSSFIYDLENNMTVCISLSKDYRRAQPQISPNSRYLVYTITLAQSGILHVYDLFHKATLYKIDSNDLVIQCAKITPDSKYIVYVARIRPTYDDRIYIRSLVSSECVKILGESHEFAIAALSLQISPDGRYIGAIDEYGGFYLISLETFTVTRFLESIDLHPLSLSFNKDKIRIRNGRTMYMGEITTTTTIDFTEHPIRNHYALKQTYLTNDDRYFIGIMAMGDNNCYIEDLYQTDNNSIIWSIPVGPGRPCYDFMVTMDENRIVTRMANNDGIIVWQNPIKPYLTS